MPKKAPTQSNAPQQQIASPFSTGGGGTVFELKVQTGLLATLLVQGHIPSFENASLRELHLQAEHSDYETDDAVLIAHDSGGQQRRQLWSVKHDVRFTESDEVLSEVIADAWADFVEPKRFTPEFDAMVLATGPLAKTYRHLLPLLEFARAAASSDSFYARIGRKGFISEKAREYVALIHKRCDETAGRVVSPAEVWRFLRCFHVLGYDFDQSASQDEARFKSLLAIAIQKTAGKTGEDLWNAIFKWVADGNPRAKSFTRETLPSEWQQLSTGIGAHFESGAIQRLLEHSRDLLKRIRVSLGSTFQLQRQELTESLSAAFLNEEFALVTGQAGVGKSAASLIALREILCGAPLFVFQAAEFARENLDHALADLRVTEPLSQISALFGLHRRKFLLIESVERLLEATQRDAFFALLSRLAEDATWRVILTCRQHAASMVRDAFLTPLDINAAELLVPLLENSELEEAMRHFPALQNVGSHPRTRELLRNPYYLDKACSVDWSKESSIGPLDQRGLREILWKQVVVRDDARAGGIHLQRDRCFQEIALRRARSLESFVAVAAGEEPAAQALIADELLVAEPITNRVAPAHDVLEDWALMRWVSSTFASHGKDPGKFFEMLGNELAVRRSYRQWLQETLTSGDLSQMRAFIDSVLTSASVKPYWKGETTVSVLTSPEAPRFFEEHETALFANDKTQLKTVIHLLRVACKKPNPFWHLPEGVLGRVFGDLHLMPDGPAWGAVIRLVHRNLSRFDTTDLPLLLGLMEDWKVGINWQAPAPDAAREVGLIALHFWNTLEDSYHWKEALERLAALLLSVPQAISSEFETVLRTEVNGSTDRYRSEILEKKLLTSLEGWSACRSHAEAVAAFGERKWGIDRPMPQRSSSDYIERLEMDGYFGLPTGLRLDYFPASALQGPFLALLQSNPTVGINLILKLSNVTTERFVEIGLDDKYQQGPIQLEIDLGGGLTCKQWASVRLWLIYREGMPCPHILASALMALEKWLLDLARSGQDLRDLTRALILQSNCVSVTAVVASVAMAHVDKVGDTVLALLRTPEFFDLDLQRYVHDQRSISAAIGDSGLNPMQKVHHKDRLESDKLAHRKQNLEFLACHIQTTALRDEVWKIIDKFKSHLPPLVDQHEGHKLWRLRLHRIDLRNFTPQEKMDDGRVVFAAGPPEPDVAEVVEKSAPTLRASQEATSLMVWGLSVFERRDAEKFDPKCWPEMLKTAKRLAREHEGKDSIEILPHAGGPGYTAAICVRDHWAELAPEERAWCRELLMAKATADKDTDNEMLRARRFSMCSAVAAAQVLPLLLADSDEPTRSRVRQAIADAITHAIEEIRQYAAAAAGWYLWERDANMASACIRGLLELAQIERRNYNKWRRTPFQTRGSLQNYVGDDIRKIRTRIATAQSSCGVRFPVFSVTESFSANVLPLIGSIIARQHSLHAAQNLQLQIAKSFVHSWRRDHRGDRRRHHEAEAALKRQFADFIVRCDLKTALELWKPVADAITQHPDEVAEFFKQLIYAEDAAQKGAAFWAAWQTTKERLLLAPDLHKAISYERSGYAKLSSVLLLDRIHWKEGAREWKPLRGHEGKIRDLFRVVGQSPPICQSFVRLLDGVGAFLAPEALNWLADQLRKGDRSRMIGHRNSLFSLARILTPTVFSQTEALRKNSLLRDATLLILDAMVEQGSSAAFRMRDFLITPIAPGMHISCNESSD